MKKVICRAVGTGVFKGGHCSPERCHHSKPHKCDSYGSFCNRPYEFGIYEELDCDCIDLPLEYIMREILKKEDKKKK